MSTSARVVFTRVLARADEKGPLFSSTRPFQRPPRPSIGCVVDLSSTKSGGVEGTSCFQIVSREFRRWGSGPWPEKRDVDPPDTPSSRPASILHTSILLPAWLLTYAPMRAHAFATLLMTYTPCTPAKCNEGNILFTIAGTVFDVTARVSTPQFPTANVTDSLLSMGILRTRSVRKTIV